MTRTLLAALAVSVALPAAAVAGEKSGDRAYVQVGLGYTQISYGDLTADLGVTQTRVGANLAPFLGVEGELSVGVLGTEFDYGGGYTATAMIDYGFGGFGVVRAPIDDNFRLFARAGYAHTQASLELTALNVSETITSEVDGLAFGGGFEFFSGPHGVRAEYTRYTIADAQPNDLEAVNVVSIGYVRRF